MGKGLNLSTDCDYIISRIRTSTDCDYMISRIRTRTDCDYIISRIRTRTLSEKEKKKKDEIGVALLRPSCTACVAHPRFIVTSQMEMMS